MKFILTGGGDFECFQKIEKELKNSLGANEQVLLLPYACDRSEFPEILERVEDTFDSNTKILMHPQPSQLSKSDFEDSAAICIEGGNTFDLVETIRKENLATFLNNLPRTKWIYADSAGAIILGSNVQTAFLGDDADEDVDRLQDYRGLDLLEGWTIHAHYEPGDDESLQDLVYNLGTPICAIPEPAAICIDGKGGLQVLTNEDVFVFNMSGKKLLAGNSAHDISDLW